MEEMCCKCVKGPHERGRKEGADLSDSGNEQSVPHSPLADKVVTTGWDVPAGV